MVNSGGRLLFYCFLGLSERSKLVEYLFSFFLIIFTDIFAIQIRSVEWKFVGFSWVTRYCKYIMSSCLLQSSFSRCGFILFFSNVTYLVAA